MEASIGAPSDKYVRSLPLYILVFFYLCSLRIMISASIPRYEPLYTQYRFSMECSDIAHFLKIAKYIFRNPSDSVDDYTVCSVCAFDLRKNMFFFFTPDIVVVFFFYKLFSFFLSFLLVILQVLI